MPEETGFTGGKAPYSALAVANSFIELAESHETQLDHMQLQKLIYYAHGWCLAFSDKPLIDEEIQAWPYGPVIESVYHKFKRFGANSIGQVVKSHYGDDLYAPRVNPNDHEIHELLHEIWRVYGNYSGIQLSNMSHQEGTPWSEVWDSNKDGLRSLSIPNSKIKTYFKSKLDSASTNEQ